MKIYTSIKDLEEEIKVERIAYYIELIIAAIFLLLFLRTHYTFHLLFTCIAVFTAGVDAIIYSISIHSLRMSKGWK